MFCLSALSNFRGLLSSDLSSIDVRGAPMTHEDVAVVLVYDIF
jgi:hypothetical protein